MSKATTFGQWLKQQRKVLGLTQKELAKQAGCAEVTLRKIEAGNFQPSAQLAASLVKAVGAADADLPGLVSLARRAGDDFTAKARLLRPQRPNNLAAQLTPLIGRERDIAAVRKRLLSDGARLITLLGPPGVGKTRLALAVAEDVLEHFEHGVFFVRLAPITDPDLVATAIAQALELQMTGLTPPALQLRAYLEEKHLLLLLDNFEQVVQAAPLVDDLLRRCPWLHVLVTSREPLRVRGERQMTVHPLALPTETRGASNPTAEEVLRYSAVALFAERAEAVQPDFVVSVGNAAAIAELCRQLDGLPLAIELVAARIKLLPPAELVARLRGPWLLSMDGLRDVSARQKTLRGAVGWSYDLLTLAEQTLFNYLAVFVGGCTLDAAQLLCGEDLVPSLPASLSAAQVLDGIASLLDKSLLHRETGQHGEARYAMLETVREYALERLVQRGQEATLRERHVSCFLRIIETTEHMDIDPGRVQLLRRVDDEVHNVRAVLDWAMRHDVQGALLLTAIMLEWLISHGSLAEGLRIIREVFALPTASVHTIPRARALWAAGTLMFHRSDMDSAQAYIAESLVLSQELNYDRGEAAALIALGRITNRQSYDQSSARLDQERALSIYRASGDVGYIAYALVLLAQTYMFQGDFLRARALCEESLAVAQQAGFPNTWPLYLLGFISSRTGDLGGAKSFHGQALPPLREERSMGLLAYTLTDLGSIAIREGEFALAHRFLEEALVLHKNFGSIRAADILLPWANLHRAEGDIKGAVRLYRTALAALGNDRGSGRNLLLLDLATVANALDQDELTAHLLGASDAQDKEVRRLWPIERVDYDHLAEAARARLGAERFHAAWIQGRGLAFEQAAKQAISILEMVQFDHANSSRSATI